MNFVEKRHLFEQFGKNSNIYKQKSNKAIVFWNYILYNENTKFEKTNGWNLYLPGKGNAKRKGGKS